MCQVSPSYNLLKNTIISRYGTMRKFGRAVGLSDAALSHIFSGKNTLTQQNMLIFAEKLEIPHEQFYDFYFT